jgi:tetratricopeptide (TPR) repeat protein
MAPKIYLFAVVLLILSLISIVQPFSKFRHIGKARRVIARRILGMWQPSKYNQETNSRSVTTPELFCSSVNKEVNSASKRGKVEEDERQQRFIHPQVYKMFHRAQYLIRQGNSTVAHKLLVRCLELNPYDSHSWLALGRLEAKLGNVIRAREVFVEGIARCPNNVHILHAWGLMEQVFAYFIV